jgi:hypothetical protein
MSFSDPMNRFIFKAISYTLVVGILAVVLDYVITSGLRQTEEYQFQTYDAILDGRAEADLLIMGNSRGFSHFDPRILETELNIDCFNISIGGYPFNIQYHLRYKPYRQFNAPPKIIVQNVDFWTLDTIKSIKHGHESEQFFLLTYHQRMREKLRQNGYGLTDAYFPLWRYHGYQQVIKQGLLEFFGIKHYDNRPSYKGYYPEHGSIDPGAIEAMAPVSGNLDPQTFTLMEQFLGECRRENIQVVLVNSPVYYPATYKITNMNSPPVSNSCRKNMISIIWITATTGSQKIHSISAQQFT